MLRIAVGGFQHETNTFSDSKAELADFTAADAWPPLVRGREMERAVAGINLPVAGFMEEIRTLGHDVVPLVWCSATPSGPVTRDAFESIWSMFAAGLEEGGFDGVYLDLHGAMVADCLDDGEGEMLRRLRDEVGKDVPVVASLDFHSNTSPAMVENSWALVAYRTYPHVDMADTGRRVARLMDHLLSSGRRPRKAYRQLPFLIPLPWQCTLTEPMSSLVERAKLLEQGGVLSVSLTPGFPLADVPACGPAVVAYGTDRAEVDGAVEQLSSSYIDREAGFRGELLSPREAVARAMAVSQVGPVILADTQDNPGGGGTSDGVTILKILVEQGADSIVAMIWDPEVAMASHRAGAGAFLEAELGGKSGVPGESPLRGRYIVEAIGNGRITGSGPFYAGCRMDLGPVALLRLGRVRAVVSSKKQQAADRAFLHHVGIRPEEERILVLKSSVHFRADFSEMASEILLVEAPGHNAADTRKLSYRHLRTGLRTSPMGQEFAGQ
jgi:microcystin degradation protein MlrC